ncbi:beta-trefoil DNA-binding domain-containing protein [Favolaschia claudopus]|uniref:Beta-trefoil DNA-binding domain-containing protein n=1 Tax=Favolaschia claudopus TaxID=2862362 RepID=A0AAW0AR90_9AGAR
MSVVSEHSENLCEHTEPLDSNMTSTFKALYISGEARTKSIQLSLKISEPSNVESNPAVNNDVQKSTWIVSGKPVSLFHRIHAQTLSTKYMTMEHGTLSATFNMQIVLPATDTLSTGQLHPITHCCSIILTDTCSGISSTACQNDGSPVNQMEKIALRRVNPDGTRRYLSTPRLASAGREDNLQLSATGSPPHTRHRVENGVQIEVDDLDDHLCWTIVGISKLQYTFFDARALNDSSNLSYADPTTGERLLLDIYIGSLGPLPTCTHQGRGATGTTVAVVQMPSIEEVVRALEKDTAMAAEGSSLPLLFIRPTDSVGYRMGPTIGLLHQALRVL